jgi:hypothetical protein
VRETDDLERTVSSKWEDNIANREMFTAGRPNSSGAIFFLFPLQSSSFRNNNLESFVLSCYIYTSNCFFGLRS